MAAKHTLHVALTQPLVQHVRDQVAAGRYVNPSAVLREALRALMERDGPTQDRVGLSAERRAPHHG